MLCQVAGSQPVLTWKRCPCTYVCTRLLMLKSWNSLLRVLTSDVLFVVTLLSFTNSAAMLLFNSFLYYCILHVFTAIDSVQTAFPDRFLHTSRVLATLYMKERNKQTKSKTCIYPRHDPSSNSRTFSAVVRLKVVSLLMNAYAKYSPIAGRLVLF